ncbi:MAG: Cof-type HAD-IIB family hydrolase [Fibrobacterota bacterium]|nr:Cof-type HAD-IIB family hydrolase [Fibrobacterota bacterium]
MSLFYNFLHHKTLIIPASQGAFLHPLPYRALALDLDGTLLDSQGKLPLRTAALLRTLAACGLRIILASGRMTARVLPFAEQLGVPMTVVSYNGAEILEGGPSGWEVVSSRGLPDPARMAVLSLCRAHRVFLNVYAAGKLHAYHPQGDFTWSIHYEINSGATYAGKHARLEDLPSSDISKLLVIESPRNRERLYEQWLPLLEDLCVLTKSNPEYLEFLAKDVNKGSALKLWMDGNGILPSDLLAFGDAENDLEMLKLAGLGMAMANATPGLRAAYSRFSPWSNAQEGVAIELGRLFNLPLDS